MEISFVWPAFTSTSSPDVVSDKYFFGIGDFTGFASSFSLTTRSNGRSDHDSVLSDRGPVPLSVG